MRDLSKRYTASLMASLSMFISPTSWRSVAVPIPSIMLRTFSSPGSVSSDLRAANLSASSESTYLTRPRMNLPSSILPDSLIFCQSFSLKSLTLLKTSISLPVEP